MDRTEDSELAVLMAQGDRKALADVYDLPTSTICTPIAGLILVIRCFGIEMKPPMQRNNASSLQLGKSARFETKQIEGLAVRHRNLHDCLRRLRRRSRETVGQETVEREPSGLSEEGDIDIASLQEQEWSAANGLASRDHALLELHGRHGPDGQELADAVGVKPTHVYVIVNRLKYSLNELSARC